jgi:hypothetical protein
MAGNKTSLVLHGTLSSSNRCSSFTRPSTLPDLTGQITRESDYYSAYGGSADIWKGIWLKNQSNRKVHIDIQYLGAVLS